MKMITLKKYQSRWVLALVEYDFKIKYHFQKINSIDELLKCFDYKNKFDDKICLFILKNKLKNTIITIIDLIFVITCNFKKYWQNVVCEKYF